MWIFDKTTNTTKLNQSQPHLTQQNAPLGRAVIGGLIAATLATHFVLPLGFALLQRRATVAAASIDPDDPQDRHYDRNQVSHARAA